MREVFDTHAVALQERLRHLDHVRGRHLEDVAAVHHGDVVAPLELGVIRVGPVLEADARDVELLEVVPVGVQLLVEDPALAVRGLEHHRRRRVPEEHGEVAEARVPGVLFRRGRGFCPAVQVLELRGRPRHEAGVDLGPHEEDRPRQARADVGVHELQTVEEPRALLADVEAGHGGKAELGLEDGPRPGEVVVGGHGGEDHEVDRVLLDARQSPAPCAPRPRPGPTSPVPGSTK